MPFMSQLLPFSLCKGGGGVGDTLFCPPDLPLCSQNAVRIQRESLPLKRSAFGDLSQEVAETLQLIGGAEMTQGDMRRAHSSMSKVTQAATPP